MKKKNFSVEQLGIVIIARDAMFCEDELSYNPALSSKFSTFQNYQCVLCSCRSKKQLTAKDT